MKKKLLMFFVAVAIMSCSKEETPEKTPEKPSVESLTVSKITHRTTLSGTLWMLSVNLTLKLPEESAVKALDYIKDGYRYIDWKKGPVLKNGLNEFTIGGTSSEALVNGTYTFILVLKDGSEVTSSPQIVK